MFLIDSLITAPGKAVFFLFESLAKRAQEEWLDDEPVKQSLREIYVQLEARAISEQEFALRESQLLERLQAIQSAKAAMQRSAGTEV